MGGIYGKRISRESDLADTAPSFSSAPPDINHLVDDDIRYFLISVPSFPGSHDVLINTIC